VVALANNTCPNPDCHANVEEMRKTLYGETGTGGVVGCLKDKIPKKWIFYFIATFGIPLFSIGVKLWADNQSNALKYATRRSLALHETRLQILEERYSQIIKKLNKLETLSDETRKDIKRLLERSSQNGK